jgi:carboxyl-terminal processing protease
MAGAMRDQLGIKLIGTKSFGKGSVQEQITLSDESFLKVTIAKWQTPNGANIHGDGLVPDIEVEMTDNDDEDAQLDAAVEFLREL